MSGLVMGLVLKHSRSRGTSKLVAVTIGDCCKDDGTGAWPAVRTIAARAGTSERTAQRSIAELVQLGELAVDENAGPKRANLYTIRIDRLIANGVADKLAADRLAKVLKRQDAKSTPVPELRPVRGGDEGCQDERVEGDRIETDGDKAVSSDPSYLSDPSFKNRPEPSLSRDCVVESFSNHSARTPEVMSPFEVAWSIYPKRGGSNNKVGALKAWNATIERERKRSGSAFKRSTIESEMLDGTRRYAKYVRDECKERSPYLLEAKNFFGPDEHFRDEFLPEAESLSPGHRNLMKSCRRLKDKEEEMRMSTPSNSDSIGGRTEDFEARLSRKLSRLQPVEKVGTCRTMYFEDRWVHIKFNEKARWARDPAHDDLF
jgi:hypothetical protein